jgi:hypothetical protein
VRLCEHMKRQRQHTERDTHNAVVAVGHTFIRKARERQDDESVRRRPRSTECPPPVVKQETRPLRSAHVGEERQSAGCITAKPQQDTKIQLTVV